MKKFFQVVSEYPKTILVAVVAAAALGALFADDAKLFRFADVVPNTWRFCDWKDF